MQLPKKPRNKTRGADAMFNRGKEELKLEGLQIQYDLLEALVARHKIWADDCLEPDIERVHMEIIELIWQTREKYSMLLARYNNPRKSQLP